MILLIFSCAFKFDDVTIYTISVKHWDQDIWIVNSLYVSALLSQITKYRNSNMEYVLYITHSEFYSCKI